MATLIQLKFNNLIETFPIEEGSELSLPDLISFASASFGVNLEKAKIYQESSDTGNLVLIASNEALKQVLNSSINSYVLRIIMDEPSITTENPKRKKQLEKKIKKEKKEKWIERKSRLAFEYASKHLNEEHGTSITPQDLKIIFDRMDIHPFRLMRCNLLPRGFFKKSESEDEKVETDDWLHVINHNSSCNEDQGAMCNEFDRMLKLEETSDSHDDSNEDSNEEDDHDKKDNEKETKKDMKKGLKNKDEKKEKHKKKLDVRVKMIKRGWKKMFEHHHKHPPMHPMMMHYAPTMFGSGVPPPPPFHHPPHHHHHHHSPHRHHSPHHLKHKHRHHHHKDDEHESHKHEEFMHPPFNFHHPPPPHHPPHHFPFPFFHPPHHHHPAHHRHCHPPPPSPYFYPFFCQQSSSEEERTKKN